MGTERTQTESDIKEATSDSLPVPALIPDEQNVQARYLPTESIEPRIYIEIRPSETMVDPDAVVHAMAHLHTLLQSHTQTGLKHSLRGSTQIPLVEWLLISDGGSDPRVRYLVGTNYVDLTEDLLGILRTCFPNTYEFRTVDWHPRDIEEYLPLIDTTGTEHSLTLPTGETLETTLEPYVAGVEYAGHTARKADWQTPFRRYDESRRNSSHSRSRTQTQQTPTAHRAESHRNPLSVLLETIRDATVPVIYQAVCQPYADWESQANAYVRALEEGTVSTGDRILEFISPRSQEDRAAYDPPLSDRERIEAISRRDSRRTFQVSARAVTLTRHDRMRADAVARRLSNALSGVNGQFHEVRGHVQTDEMIRPLRQTPPGSALYRDLINRAIYTERYVTASTRLPWKQPQSRGMIVGAAELPGFCLIDGAALTPNGQRGLATRPGEQTALRLPPPGQLIRYTPPGMALCMPLTHDRQPYGQSFYLRPSQQDRHLVVVGDTGAGKSVLMETGLLTNAQATDGPEILFDYKGGGTASEYLQMHFATYGSLEDVYYFDLSRVLPAFSVFDISPLLASGVPREEARSRKAGHYEEILQGLMGAEKYGEAAESVKAIRNHLRALYDPVHGEDAVSHADLYAALQRTQRGEGMPETSDESLAAYFTGLAERDRDVFNMILGGAVGRVETIATDGRLAPLFDHLPANIENGDTADESDTGGADSAPGSSATFDFTEIINDDAVVIFDFAGMEGKIKRALTLVILSNLWTALKARNRDGDRHETQTESPPQVNLYLEEARDIGATKLLDTLLSEGRSFGLSIALGLQFLEQLDSSRSESKTYQEALNETATFLVGNVTVDTDLSQVLTTDDLSADDIETRMSALSRGEWLVRPGTDFGEDAVRPFLARSLPAPTGHPASENPLAGSEQEAFKDAFARVERETALQAGLPHDGEVIAEDDGDDEGSEEPDATEMQLTGETPHPDLRVDTLLTHTQRMPDCVSYDDQLDALHCGTCSNRYDPDIAGMIRAIECCHSLDNVDRDDIPVCDFNLKLSHNEILAADWSLQQLLFLQAVYNAQQRRYDPHEYDLQFDSMVRLQEYVGIEAEAVTELLEAGLLRHDTDHPHRMYSVSADGRSAIVESYRQGLDFGHGVGDLEESTEHVFGVDIGVRLLEERYQANPESAVETVRPYHELSESELPAAAFMGDGDDAESASNQYEQRRLDVAGLDAEGNVVVVIEVERVNHDIGRAVPEDFDKMAACEPEEAIWLVMTRSDGHKILETLNDPLAGEPRVEKTYSPNTPPQQFNIDTPGLTALYPLGYVRDSLLE